MAKSDSAWKGGYDCFNGKLSSPEGSSGCCLVLLALAAPILLVCAALTQLV